MLYCLFQKWLQNCKATFPRYPDDNVITCQPGDSEEKVRTAIYTLKWPQPEIETIYLILIIHIKEYSFHHAIVYMK